MAKEITESMLRKIRTARCMDETSARMFRKMTEWERIEHASNLRELAKDVLDAFIRTDHPDWSEAEIAQEVRWRLLLEAFA